MTSFKLLHAVRIDTRFHNTRLMVSELTVLNPADYSFSVFFLGHGVLLILGIVGAEGHMLIKPTQ